MTKIALIAGGIIEDIPRAYDVYVGIDYGCVYLLEHQFPLDIGIGDFDSVSKEEWSWINSNAKEIIKAPRENDDTDTELALQIVLEKHPDAEVYLYGCFGGRIDHLLSNLILPSHPALTKYMQQIHLCDKQNEVIYKSCGYHQVSRKDGFSYISFLAEGGENLEILGAKYELTSESFFKRKIYSSNEFLEGPIQVFVDHGYLVVIYSRDRR